MAENREKMRENPPSPTLNLPPGASQTDRVVARVVAGILDRVKPSCESRNTGLLHRVRAFGSCIELVPGLYLC